MKVLKHGNHYRKAVVTCEYCGCEFEVLQSECNKPEWSRLWEIDCPECNNYILLGKKDFQTELSEKEK